MVIIYMPKMYNNVVPKNYDFALGFEFYMYKESIINLKGGKNCMAIFFYQENKVPEKNSQKIILMRRNLIIVICTTIKIT